MTYKYSEPHSVIKRVSKSKTLLLVLLTIFVFVASAAYKENKGQRRAVNNINTLEQEIAKLENKNMELADLIQYLKSDDFVDREAREKLNMQQPGEQVMLVPKEGESDSGQVSGASDIQERSNWQLWQEYFFGE
ncbi:MAG TPA: septum formation initiator family protein [Patescibacteria group bacterium]|nr:septum formation initiator family protein [Patescibacteria group bacterium]